MVWFSEFDGRERARHAWSTSGLEKRSFKRGDNRKFETACDGTEERVLGGRMGLSLCLHSFFVLPEGNGFKLEYLLCYLRLKDIFFKGLRKEVTVNVEFPHRFCQEVRVSH